MLLDVELLLSPLVGHDGKIRATAKVVRCERIGDKAGIGVTFQE